MEKKYDYYLQLCANIKKNTLVMKVVILGFLIPLLTIIIIITLGSYDIGCVLTYQAKFRLHSAIGPRPQSKLPNADNEEREPYLHGDTME